MQKLKHHLELKLEKLESKTDWTIEQSIEKNARISEIKETLNYINLNKFSTIGVIGPAYSNSVLMALKFASQVKENVVVLEKIQKKERGIKIKEIKDSLLSIDDLSDSLKQLSLNSKIHKNESLQKSKFHK